MKNYKLLLVGFLASLFFACEKDSTANLSKITFFPDLVVEGDDTYFVQCGSNFSVPGVKATENGVEIPLTTTVTGEFRGGTTFDTNVPDKYVFNYSATNKDGYDGNAQRTVWVACNGDLVNSLEGLYTSTVVRNTATGAQYTNMKYIMIWKNADGTYGISDAIGGYYDIGRAYGAAYQASGIKITANSIPGNNFSFNGPVGVGAFGGVLNMVPNSMVVDPAAGTIKFDSDWDAGYVFHVTLTQVKI